MRKNIFHLIVALLIILLVIVSFYVLYVHIPYYQYHHQLDEIRNEICETNHYEYLDYFYAYHGNKKEYILKVKINGMESFVAYDEDLNLVNTYQGIVADEEEVKKNILNKYEISIDHLDIAYEDNQFVYYGKYQDDSVLCYVYYRLDNGEFVKAVKLGE